MYTKLLKEIMVDIEYNQQAKINLVGYCRDQYKDNPKELRMIDEFNKSYTPSLAIQWYTRECFAYHMLNKALRNLDIEIILKMGFFLRDLHRQITQLHAKQQHGEKLIVYRGQGMMNEEFEQLLKCSGGLISFNSFLSTSADRNVGLRFSIKAQKDPNVKSILFQMTIYSSISFTPFAFVNDQSYYRYDDEQEILFSMHTVFQIETVKELKDGIWQVNLKLTDDNHDEQLRQLTDHMRDETSSAAGWHRLGALLIAMGQFDMAKDFYHAARVITPENNWKELAHICAQLGLIHDETDNPEDALEYYNAALKLQLEHVPKDDPTLSMTYNGIGSALHSQYQLDEALEYFQKALDIAPETTKHDLLLIAKIHGHIGGVLHDQKEDPEALDSYEQALSIRKEHLPSLHPLLATTYNNIALVHQSMGDHQKTYSYLKKAVKIESKVLPPEHRTLAVTYHNTAKALENLGRYEDAVKYQQGAVNIMQEIYESTDPQRQREEKDLERLQKLLKYHKQT